LVDLGKELDMNKDVLISLLVLIGFIIFMVVSFKKVMQPFKNDEGKYDKGELMKVGKIFLFIIIPIILWSLFYDLLFDRL
tara:strand:- start:101 stop:340 length:240 start_codon:yes stop_codon:yes gene_type:complete